MRSMKLALTVALSLIGASAYAAQGDLLFQCGFDGSGATPQEVWHSCDPASTNIPPANELVSIINTGCVSGKCYKMAFAPKTPGVYSETWFPMKFYPPTTITAFTAEWYERYSHSPVVDSNIKSARATYPGTDGTNYMMAPISSHSRFGGEPWRPWQYTTAGSPDTSTGSLTIYSNNITNYVCAGGGTVTDNPRGCIGGRAFNWREANDMSQWRKVRWYLKPPTNNTTEDGELWYWVNDILMFKRIGAQDTRMVSPYGKLVEIIWEPSIGAAESVTHYYDEIKVWEGFVAPDGSSPLKAPSSPTSLLIE